MTDSEVTVQPGEISQRLRELIISGDLSKLTPPEFVSYYQEACRRIGVNWITKPFDFIRLNGKLVLYLNRGGADQLRKVHDISIEVSDPKVVDGMIYCHAKASLPNGRVDEDYGYVPFPKNSPPEVISNKYLHAVTKAKRRATLSVVGLGWLDETEIESIPARDKQDLPAFHEELKRQINGDPGTEDDRATE